MKLIFSGNRYANITSTLALVVALGGTGAYAASTISSKDIRNGQVKNADLAHNAVTGSKVRNGTLTGDDFKKGAAPTGAKGAAGATGAQGPAGPAFPDVLPSGQTLRGSYSFSGYYAGSNPYSKYDMGPADGQISFQIPLPSEPTVVISPKGAGPVTHCPGSITNPQAQAGYLCVYESSISDNDALTAFSPQTGVHDIATRFGVGLFVTNPAGPASDHRTSKGSWAVTALCRRTMTAAKPTRSGRAGDGRAAERYQRAARREHVLGPLVLPARRPPGEETDGVLRDGRDRLHRPPPRRAAARARGRHPRARPRRLARCTRRADRGLGR